MSESRDATPEELRAVEVARELARAGVRMFVCPPNPYKPGKYFFKADWQNSPADPAVLDEWQPGYGIGAVGGSAADFLDVDPRNGGQESAQELKQAGQWPLTFGTAGTPSGGTHHVISRSGERKETGFMPGLDFQAGGDVPDEKGSYGRAFVWLAPTVGKSKVTGELVPYRWIEEPDVHMLDEWRLPDGTSSDPSIEGVVARVMQHRGRQASATAPVTGTIAPDDPFLTMSQATALQPRTFTLKEAQDFVRPALLRLREAPIGQIEQIGMDCALQIEHFVPEFWSPAEAFGYLSEALSHTAYDPNGPSDWTSDKFLARLDGRRPVLDSWKASKKIDIVYTAPAPIEPVITGRLRKAMLKRSEVHALPDPVPLIEDVLYRNSVTVLSGKFGTYKSFVAVSWAASLATGTSWFGHAVPQRVPVIYAAAEGAYGIRKRLDAWEAEYGVIPDDLYLIPISVRLNRPDDMAELCELIAETKAQVLIFDTLHASTPGMDENDAGEAGAVLDVLRGLQERFGICAVLPHHTGHSGERARGSSSIEDDADVSFVIKLDGESRGPENKRTLVHRKTKDSALLEPVTLALNLVPAAKSGYVTGADSFDAADGSQPTVDIGQERVIQEPQAWTYEITRPDADIQRRILQTLWDVAGTIGVSYAEALAFVRARWHGTQKSSGPGCLKSDTFKKAWVKVLELSDDDGEAWCVPGSKGAQSFIVNPSLMSETP